MPSETKLYYQSTILIGGAWIACVESYESIFERMREANFKIAPDEGSETDGSMKWAAPIELTVRANDSDGNPRPIRVAIQPMQLGAVMEIPADDREAVEV